MTPCILGVMKAPCETHSFCFLISELIIFQSNKNGKSCFYLKFGNAIEILLRHFWINVVSLSHQVVGSKQPLCRFASGRLASVFPFLRPHSCGSLRHWVCPFKKVCSSPAALRIKQKRKRPSIGKIKH